MHRGCRTLMGIMPLTHSVMVVGVLAFKLMRIGNSKLLTWMELFKRSLILERTNLVRVFDACGRDTCRMLIIVLSVGVRRELRVTWLMHIINCN